MNASSASGPTSAAPARRRGPAARLIGAVGWLLLGLGLVVVLYLIYSLWFTNLGTERAQARLRDDFSAQVEQRRGEVVAAPSPVPTSTPTPAPAPTPTPSPPPVESEPPEAPDDPVVAEVPQDGDGSAMALLWFERPGEEAPPVTDDRYVVVDGVTLADLAAGPGHYPRSGDPGKGNFAVAGHRTTHGAPFFRLDELREGDEIHVVDLDGVEHVYRVVRQRIVAPSEVWVVGDDPIGRDRPTITLTTCHPRFSNRQRLVVFGELVA